MARNRRDDAVAIERKGGRAGRGRLPENRAINRASVFSDNSPPAAHWPVHLIHPEQEEGIYLAASG